MCFFRFRDEQLYSVLGPSVSSHIHVFSASPTAEPLDDANQQPLLRL